MSDIENLSFDSDDFDLAMKFRSIASQLASSLMELIALGGCRCVQHEEIVRWQEGMPDTMNIGDRMRYAQENPCPSVDEPIVSQCKHCEAMEAYNQLIGEEASYLEHSKFLQEHTMPPALKEIFDHYLGHFDKEVLKQAFMGGRADDEVIRAFEIAQQKANEYLSNNYNTD